MKGVVDLPTSTPGASLSALLSLLAAGCTLQVDSVVDAPDGDPGDGVCASAGPAPRGQGLCTLRAAVMEANANFLAQRIEIPAGTYSLTLPDPLVVASSVAIRGANAATTIIDAEATGYDGGPGCPQAGPEKPVFRVQSGSVAIRYLTLRDGFAQLGGGLRVDGGEVEISDAVIRRNAGFTGAGGVYATGGVTRMRRTSIIENCATGAFGGGMLVSSGAQMWVYDSLIANNRSNRAGGIRNAGQLNLRSTTISGNIAHSPSAGTGGLSQNGFAVLNNVTITNNTGRGSDPNSFQGGGLQSTSIATTVVKNSIVAGNDGQGGPNDCAGSLTGDSRNSLIGDSSGCVIPSHLATFLLDVDAQLAPLGFNGGPTQTHALLTASPARDAAYQFPPPAINACEMRDQRGVPRPQGAGPCDMGAFEAGAASAFATSFVLVDADTDTDLFTIRNGELLNLAVLPPNLSVRVQVSPLPGSVVFAFDDDPNYQSENNAPYALGGDNPAGDYTPVSITPGEHTIRATPFAGTNATGAAGGSLAVQFTAIGEPSS